MVISRIVRLGPAEGCLQVGDEIQYVNEVKVIGATGDRVIMLVKTADNERPAKKSSQVNPRDVGSAWAVELQSFYE